jgi:hypothetical protein
MSNCTDLVSAIGGALVANNVDDAQSTELTAPIWTVQNYDDPTIADIDVPSAYAGGESGQPLPTQTALLVSQRTDKRGRSFRGRQYWPGYTEASSDENSINPTTVDNMVNAQADVITDVAGVFSGAEPVVISELTASATGITTILVEDTWATQRRRNERLR